MQPALTHAVKRSERSHMPLDLQGPAACLEWLLAKTGPKSGTESSLLLGPQAYLEHDVARGQRGMD